LGIEAIRSTLGEGVLQLPAFSAWTVLTHEAAAEDWTGDWKCRVLPTYRLAGGYSEQAASLLSAATHVFWSSASQFDALKDKVSRNAHQACGPGKTAEHLFIKFGQLSEKTAAAPVVFPSAEEWRKWIKGD
jgi:hypothetical protein